MYNIIQKPKVSIIIPAYNAMAYLPEALESVLNQTFTDFEIIIVNDGSTDEIEIWAESIQDPRVRIVTQQNRGLAGARNTGIREAQGQYLAFLDADDLWHPTKLGKQVEILETSPTVGLVYTWMRLIGPTGIPTGRTFQNSVEGRVWRQLILCNFVGSGSTPIVRKECFDQLGIFDENLGSYMEDQDMWLRLAPYYDFAVVPELLVDYRQHPSSASKNWTAMVRSATIILEKAFATAPIDISQQEKVALYNQTWGRINLSLAWKPLQSREKDYQTSQAFVKKALKHDFSLLFSWDLWRLVLTILLMRLFGEQSYNSFLDLFCSFRRWFLPS